MGFDLEDLFERAKRGKRHYSDDDRRYSDHRSAERRNFPHSDFSVGRFIRKFAAVGLIVLVLLLGLAGAAIWFAWALFAPLLADALGILQVQGWEGIIQEIRAFFAKFLPTEAL